MEDKEYIILLAAYKKMFNDLNNIPQEWYNVKEYDLKKKILKDCLENKIMIVDSKYYYAFRLIALNS